MSFYVQSSSETKLSIRLVFSVLSVVGVFLLRALQRQRMARTRSNMKPMKSRLKSMFCE